MRSRVWRLGSWVLVGAASLACSSRPAAPRVAFAEPPPPTLELTGQELEIDLAAPRLLAGRAHLRVRNPGRVSAREVPIFLSPFARLGEVRHAGRVISVRSRAPNEYRAPLDVAPGEEVRFEVDWSLDLSDAARRARLGGALHLEPGARVVELVEWHPRLSATGAVEKPPFVLRVRTPADETVVAPGRRVRVETRGEHATTVYEGTVGPAELVLVSGRFQRASLAAGGFAFEFLEPVGGGAPPRRLREVASLAARALDLFARLFGPAWDERPVVRIVVAPLRGARAFPFALLLGAEGDYLARDLASRTEGGNRRDAVFLHELAHFWWGQRLTAPGPEVAFLHEGLAEFCMLLALERLRGAEAAREVRRELRVRALRPGPALSGLSLAVPGHARYAQDRGALAFETARARLGLSTLCRALADTVRAGRGLTVSDLTRSLGHPILYELAAATELPRVHVSVGEGREIRLENRSATPAWVPLVLRGRREERRAAVELPPRSARTLAPGLASPLAEVVVDPDARTLLVVEGAAPPLPRTGAVSPTGSRTGSYAHLREPFQTPNAASPVLGARTRERATALPFLRFGW